MKDHKKLINKELKIMFNIQWLWYYLYIQSKEELLMAEENKKLEQAKGNVKETVGNATNNKDLEKEGKEDKASGKAKEVVDNVKEKANDVIDKFKK